MLKIIKQYYLWVIFAIAIIAQLWFPISTIIEKNDVLANGVEFKIKTRPIDPADPFRGRYVAIGVEVTVAEELSRPAYIRDESFYIRLMADEEGFAEVVEMSREPLEGSGVLKIQNTYYGGGPLLRLPFDRYYMAEKLAPEAERIYRDANLRNNEELTAYVAIRVKNGNGAISGLYVNDMRIEDYVRQER